MEEHVLRAWFSRRWTPLIRSRGEVKLVIDLLVAAERFGGLDVVCNLEGLARYQGKVQKSDVNTAVQVRLVEAQTALASG
jgi:hypothetical protein